MKRRTFMALVSGGLLAAPFVAEAQQPRKVHRIAYLGNSSAALESELVAAFRQGLRDLNYVEGQNVTIEYRWAESRYDRFPAFVAEAVQLKVDVIVTAGTPAILAAKDGTRTIPIVMAAIGDPIGAGVISSLAHPGGNVTGLTSMTFDIDGKRLELLKELVPGASRIAVLWNPTNPNNAARMKEMRAAAKILHLTLEPLVGAANGEELDKGFAVIVATRAEALTMESDRALLAHRARIVDFASRRRLPALYPYREFVQAGGLASYEPSYPAMFRRAATYVDKILKGAKPADLPVEQPTKFEFVINLKTAKLLSLTIPQPLLLRADELIQ
ncbi:MAG TPA: ABC transporter substrate-binding protein [Methylomirabilota bacterium]